MAPPCLSAVTYNHHPSPFPSCAGCHRRSGSGSPTRLLLLSPQALFPLCPAQQRSGSARAPQLLRELPSLLLLCAITSFHLPVPLPPAWPSTAVSDRPAAGCGAAGGCARNPPRSPPQPPAGAPPTRPHICGQLWRSGTEGGREGGRSVRPAASPSSSPGGAAAAAGGAEPRARPAAAAPGPVPATPPRGAPTRADDRGAVRERPSPARATAAARFPGALL